MSALPVQDRPATISVESPLPNLWKKALNTISAELQNCLDLTRASHTYILSRALTEAREKKQVCVQQCWTFKKPNGETIILRDVFEKIVVWIEKFIAVGDAAVQYDPAHAAPAWAAFRFVLQMAANEKKVFGDMIANLEFVSHLITRYAILEGLYLQRKSPARDKLEEMVIRLYAEILGFLAKARKFFQKSAKIRLVQSMINFSEDGHMTKIKVLDGQISRLTEVFTVDTQIETAKGVASMHALLVSLNEPIKRLVDHSSISAQDLHESKRLQILRWLSSVPFVNHHKRHSENRIPSSGQWLLAHEQYLDWRNRSSSSIFLLHGIIGSGKTSLASAVVDSFLRERCQEASAAPIAYFYCTRNSAETERSNVDEIMRSILRQLTVSQGSSPTIHERVLQEYERRQAVAKLDGFEITRLHTSDCLKLILDTTAANPATIVIDALDEIQPRLRHVLFSALNQIVHSSLNVVKIFVTSRNDSNMHALLPDAVAVRIHTDHTREDMVEFVNQEVSSAIQNRRMLNGVVSDNLRQELMGVLVAAAGEMFIWVVRQIENLCRMKTEVDVRSAMRALSTETLHELYEEDFSVLSKSGHFARSYAIQLFSLLLSAQEALSPQALGRAMARKISHQAETMTLAKMIDICLNLIVLDSELNVLRFAHISFQEYLETRAEFASCHVHKVAASICLDLCLEGIPRGTEIDLSTRDNFYHYSAVYWAEHCRKTIVHGAGDVLISKIQDFVFDEGDVALGFIDWIQEVNNFVKKLPYDHALAKALNAVIASDSSPLFTACIFGLTSILDHLAHATDYDWNQKNDSGQSGLYLAAAFGHKAIVRNLLQRNVSVNAFGGKFDHPLHVACFGGYASIVESLLEHGADPKMGSRTALDYALLADHEDVALRLLDDRLSITNQTEYDCILQQAAETGCADVVQFLQKKYASLYGDVGSSRCRAVEVAIFKGRIGVVERYMQKLSDSENVMPEDAVATAALGGQDTVIQLLVDKGLDLHHEGVFGTPLRAASVTCHESTVRLLLRLGASPHGSELFGQPLQAAAMRGSESITRIFLSHGVDVNSGGGFYGTALQAAAHRGHQKVVEILLDAGANVHQEGFSYDAFYAASEGGHEGIVRLLLERGFKAEDKFLGGAVICWEHLPEASPSRYQQRKPSQNNQQHSEDWCEQISVTDFSIVVEKIRGALTSEPELTQPYHARPTYRGRGGKAHALGVAAAKGHNTVVDLLLDQRDTLNISKTEVIAAFKEACENGHDKVASQLLSDRIKVKDLKAALKSAAFRGHLAVVNLLIDFEERVQLTLTETTTSTTQEAYQYDSTARVVLNSGSEGGDLPVLRRGQELTIQRCTDDACHHLYREALATAAANGKLDAMEVLLESNFDVDLETLTYTLNSISTWGDEKVLKVFLQHDTKKMLGIEQYSSGLNQAAAKNNHHAVMYWLQEHPEHDDIVVDPRTVINVSAYGFIDVLIPLIDHIRLSVSFENTLSRCLQIASTNGHKEVVEYLIWKGADVNAVLTSGEDYKDACYVEDQSISSTGKSGPYLRGSTPLSHHFKNQAADSTGKLSALQAALIGSQRFPCQTDHERTVKVLLANRADPNEAGEYERYPLNIAAEHCTVEIVKQLISSGAEIEGVTKAHGTALQAAARRALGGLPIVKALLEANESVPVYDLGINAALNEALSFFDTLDDIPWELNPTSMADILSTGPGAVVKMLLTKFPEEKAEDSRYCVVAQIACIAGDAHCVDLLVRRGLGVDTSIDYYGTALQAASRVGNIEIVEQLLESGANVNNLQGAHGTALRAAVIGGNENLVHVLIARGADVNLRYKFESRSLLHLALESRNYAIIRALLHAGADVNAKADNGQRIFTRACKHGDMASVELLLANGVGVNFPAPQSVHVPYQEATPLNAACAEGHSSVVRLLLDHGADIEKTNDSSATPLIAAIRGSQLLAICLLLDAGADVNHAVRDVNQAVDFTPLSEAVEYCEFEVVEGLLSRGASIGGSFSNSNPLAKACEKHQHMMAELLLVKLSGTQYETEVRVQALSAAISCEDNEMVLLLIEHSVSPSLEMLRQACAVGVLDVVRTLVDTGIDVNEDDGSGAPLLHVAASHSRRDVVLFLIDRGADVTLLSKE